MTQSRNLDATPKKEPLPKWVSVYLGALVETGNKSRAAEAAGVARSTPFRLRQSNPEFASLYSEAEMLGLENLEDEARRRALGFEEDVLDRQGEASATRRVYSDTLMIFLLKAGNPDKYRDQLAKDVRKEAQLGKGTARISIEGGDAEVMSALRDLFASPGEEDDTPS